jgi:hypothetical protein
MFTICTTRFTSTTFTEYQTWCKNNRWKGCIYGTPRKISDAITYDSRIFILEMNNTTNQIEGIGLLKNTPCTDKYYNIYSDGNYNRYIYKSLYRINISDSNLTEYEKKVIDIFNILLFKGLRNVKRYQGITEIPKWIKYNKHMDFVKFFKELFINKCTIHR